MRNVRMHLTTRAALAAALLVMLGAAPLASAQAFPSVDLDLRANPDAGQGHVVTLSAREALRDWKATPGHAMVTFDDGAWGYYATGVSRENWLEGSLDRESAASLAAVSSTLTIRVDDETYDRLLAIRKQWADEENYDLGSHDCVTFAQDIAKALGLPVPARGVLRRFPAPYMRKLFRDARAMKAQLESQAREDKVGAAPSGVEAQIEALRRERSRLFDELSRIPAIPPGPGRPERIARVREIDRLLAELAAQRVTNAGHSVPPPPAGGGDQGGGSPGEEPPTALQPPHASPGPLSVFRVRDARRLVFGIAKEGFDRAGDRLSFALGELGTSLQKAEELAADARRALAGTFDDTPFDQARRKGLQDTLQKYTPLVHELQDEIMIHEGRLSNVKRAKDILKSNWLSIASGLNTAALVRDAIREGNELRAQGRHQEAWRVYVGMGMRVTAEVVFGRVLRQIPGPAGAVLGGLVGATYESIGQEMVNLTFEASSRLGRWLKGQGWWRNLHARAG